MTSPNTRSENETAVEIFGGFEDRRVLPEYFHAEERKSLVLRIGNDLVDRFDYRLDRAFDVAEAWVAQNITFPNIPVAP